MSENEKSYSHYDTDIYKELSKQIILCVLSETLDQLAILRHVNGWSLDDQTGVEYKSIEEQCNAIKNDDVLPAETKENIDLHDFRRDCAFIEVTVQKTYDEIRSKGTYQGLSKLSNIFERLQKEEADYLQDTQRKEEEYTKLQSIYYGERMKFKINIDDTMTKIGNLKDEIEDFEKQAAIKSKYVSSWENSKTEMCKYTLTKKGNDTTFQIDEKRHEIANEDRVHHEIRQIFSEVDMDLQKQLMKWKIRYEYDFQAITAKINALQEKKEKQQEKTAEIVKMYIKRQEEIDSYKEYKLEQEKKRAEKERKDMAATKIQAWWRGTMVRKGFGKYKKKKDKKGKKKNDDKRK